MEELQLYFPHQPTSGRSEMPVSSVLQSFRKHCFSFYFVQVEGLSKEFEETMRKLEEDPQNNVTVTSLSKSDYLQKLTQVKKSQSGSCPGTVLETREDNTPWQRQLEEDTIRAP